MDIEKLIERIRWWAENCDRTNYGCHARPFLLDAATALSTLQAENAKLRDSRDRWEKCAKLFSAGIDQRDKEEEKIRAENEKLRAELENYRKGHCSEGGCAAEKDRDAALEELEQVKAERDELERFLGELEGAVYTGQYFRLRPMIEKWRGQKED